MQRKLVITGKGPIGEQIWATREFGIQSYWSGDGVM
jgi:hypothetical protein